MNQVTVPARNAIYVQQANVVIFNQLGVKIEMDRVDNAAYYGWLDEAIATVGEQVRGARIVEKDKARETPPLNTAIYYDTPDYRILPTGALLRTSCNKITHAFCAFKLGQDHARIRKDHRYVFAGREKEIIQQTPASPQAVAIVKRLLARQDIEHPGTFLRHHLDIDPTTLEPALCLDDYRFTFFVWLDGRDALRCSLDRAFVRDLRLPSEEQETRRVSEVELAIYPRIDPEVAEDPRLPQLLDVLAGSLCDRFGVAVTTDIKYQRSARALGIGRAC